MLFKIPVTTALAGALTCCLLTGGISSGQTRPEFEVASIRPSSDQVNQVNVGVRISGSQVRITPRGKRAIAISRRPEGPADAGERPAA